MSKIRRSLLLLSFHAFLHIRREFQMIFKEVFQCAIFAQRTSHVLAELGKKITLPRREIERLPSYVAYTSDELNLNLRVFLNETTLCAVQMCSLHSSFCSFQPRDHSVNRAVAPG